MEKTELTLSRQLALRVLLRWAINSFALWLAGVLIADVTHNSDWPAILTTGLILSIMNAVLKPILVILALPAILLTLGLFTLVVNGFIVYLASLLVGSFEIDSLIGAILAGMIVSLINYGLTTYLEERIFKER